MLLRCMTPRPAPAFSCRHILFSPFLRLSVGMAFYHKIPVAYLRWVPAIVFALLGIYDIGVDWMDHKLTLYHVLFNAAFLLPLLIPHWVTYLICGFLYLVISAYIFICLNVFLVQFLNGHQMKRAWDTFIYGFPLSILGLLCSLSLLYVGALPSRKPAIA